jgi:hypothetical protein
MSRVISGLLLAVVLFFAAPASAQPVGTFATAGEGYTGTVTVTQTGQTYSAQWTVGNERYQGVGIFQNGMLSFSFTGQGRSGVVIYREASPGVWEGVYAFMGEQRTHTERWTPQGGGNAPPAGSGSK